MDIEKLNKSDFGKNLSRDSVAFVKKLQPYLLKNKKRNKSAQTEREKYIHSVLSSFTEVTHMLESLEYCEIFMNSYTVSTAWSKKYDRNHYIRYHYENWVMNLVRLYERILILITDVYELEIPHKEVSYITVATAEDLKNTDTLRLLQKVHGSMSNAQAAKNQFFHRYKHDDEKLRELAMYELVSRNSTGDDEKSFSLIAKILAKKYTREKIIEVKKSNKTLVEISVAMLVTLNDKYTERAKAK